MSRSNLDFPVEDLISCVEGGRWEKCEDILPLLRLFAVKSTVAEIDSKAEHAKLVATFLLGTQERRRLLRSRVMETVKGLARSKAWNEALQSSPLLQPTAMQEGNQPILPPTPQNTVPSFEEQQSPEVLGKTLLGNLFSHCDLKRKDTPVQPLYLQHAPNPFDDATPVDRVRSASRDSSSSPASVAEELHSAVQAVLAIDSRELFENWAVSAFAQLRRAVLHAAQLPSDTMLEVLDTESDHAVDVLTCLVDVVKGSPIRSNQVCEILGILLQSARWQKAARHSPNLLERVAQSGTPPDVQARFDSIPKTKSKPGVRAKNQLRRWLFGCGQKRGQGASSPQNAGRTDASVSEVHAEKADSL